MITSSWPGRVVGLLIVPLAWVAQGAQRTPLPRTSTHSGSLSGSAYCADTNQPARFASIYLLRIAEDEFGSQSYGQTDLDGRFSLSHVAEGGYYVVAVLPGYVNLMSSLTKSHLDAMSVEERKKFLAQLPYVTVSVHPSAQISIRLERGAEIDGTVTYDDGSAAIGLRISYRLKTAEQSDTAGDRARMRSEITYSVNGQPTTDDQGHFRILGVPPGEYVVYVTVPTRSSQEAEDNPMTHMIEYPFNQLDVYIGGSIRASKAGTINVDAGGAKKDADITIPLSKLHTVRGQVLLKASGQPPVVANVQLLYADTHEVVRTVIARNGRFEFFYVSEENFVLRASAGNEAPPNLELIEGPNAAPGLQRIVWSYPQAGEDSPKIPLQVIGDVENLIIAVPDPVPNKNAPSIEFDRGGGVSQLKETLPH